ncbi:MAG: hypothetical protein IJ773_13780 [Lachnospiraceae bacterium]|nr:hypothetical protein [Lachnospiraceae bacterium]
MKVMQIERKVSVADRKTFTDRRKERALFQQILDQAQQAPDEFFAMSVYGIAGSGKSRLLQECKSILEADSQKKYIYATYDYENNSADFYQVITRLYRQLEKKGLLFPLTSAAELAYREKSGFPVFQEMGEQDVLDHPVLDILSTILPAADAVVSTLRTGKMVWQTLLDYKEKLRALWDPEKKELEKELTRIWAESDPERIRQFMPEYFRQDLCRSAQNLKKMGIACPLVIFLDTFESCTNRYADTGYTPSEEEWLKSDIIKRIPGVFWVISGREKLGWKESDEAYQEMEECSLEEFSAEDAAFFLEKAGIPVALRSHIIQVSGGVPLFLDLCVDTYYEQATDGKIIRPEEIGLNPGDVIGRFVRYMGKDDQEIAVVLALLDKWSKKDAETILPEVLGNHFRISDYQEFLQHTIIRKDKEERYYIHQSVREVILAYSREARFADLVQKVREVQARMYTLPKNAGLSEVLRVRKDLEDLRKQDSSGKEILEETERKNQEFYDRVKGIRGGGWGPVRPTYTMKSPSPVPEFNSITDNNIFGDERAFVRVAKEGIHETYEGIRKLHPFETYELYILFDNACVKKESGEIRGAKAQVVLPEEMDRLELKKVSVLLSAENTETKEVWGNAFVWSDTPLMLRYVQGSAMLYSNRKKGQPPIALPLSLFKKGGTRIGTDALDGIVPPDGSGHIILKFQAFPKTAWGPERAAYQAGTYPPSVAFNCRSDLKGWGDERSFARIRLVGEKNWQQEITLKDQSEYEVLIHYHNAADPATNPSGKGIADYVKIVAVLPNQDIWPQKSGQIVCGLSCMQTGWIWSSLLCKTEELPLDLKYVNASAEIHNAGNTNGMKLSTDLFKKGHYIGVNKLDGRLPAGEDYQGYIIFRVRTTCLRCNLNRQASLDGKVYTHGPLKAAPGDTVYFRTEFRNTGSRDIESVVFKDILPEKLAYVEGSTVLWNGANPNGLRMKDFITKNGFNTGLYGPHANGIVTYQARIMPGAEGDLITTSYLYHKEGMLKNQVIIQV